MSGESICKQSSLKKQAGGRWHNLVHLHLVWSVTDQQAVQATVRCVDNLIKVKRHLAYQSKHLPSLFKTEFGWLHKYGD
jgi:hypothetical protein